MKNILIKFAAAFVILAVILAGCGQPSSNVSSNISPNITLPPTGTNVTPPTTNDTTNVTPPASNITPGTNATLPSVNITPPLDNITPPAFNATPNITPDVTTNVTTNETANVTTNVTTNVTSNATGNATGPTINITSPGNGANLTQGNITVTVDVTGFNVTDKRGQGNSPGEGHLHFYLDIAPPTTPGVPAAPQGNVTWAHVANTTHTFTNVQPGTHIIYVQLINNDHSPLVPIVTVNITVNVMSGNVTGAPVGPGLNGNGNGGNITAAPVGPGLNGNGNGNGNITAAPVGPGLNGNGNGNITGNITGNVTGNGNGNVTIPNGYGPGAFY